MSAIQERLKSLSETFDFNKGFFDPSRAEMLDQTPLRNFGVLLAVFMGQRVHIYDWPNGKFDPVSYIMHFMLGKTFSVLHSRKMKSDLNIDKVFWRIEGNSRLKMFIVSNLENSKGRVMMKTFSFNRDVAVQKLHDWSEEDFTDIISKLGQNSKYYQFESHHYDVECQSDVAKTTNRLSNQEINALGIFMKAYYDLSMKVKPGLMKAGQRRPASRLHEVPHVDTQDQQAVFVEEYLESMMLYPEQHEKVKSASKDFLKHVISTFKQNIKNPKSTSPEAHCGFLHGTLFPLQKRFNYFVEIAQYAKERSTAQFNIHMMKHFSSDWKHLLYDYPLSFHIVDTSHDMTKLDVEKRVYQVMVEHAKTRQIAARNSFAEKMLMNYANFEAQTATVAQNELEISQASYYDLVRSLGDVANIVKDAEMTESGLKSIMHDFAAALNVELQQEILRDNLVVHDLCGKNSRCLSRYIHGILSSTSVKAYAVKHNQPNDFERDHTTTFVIETEQPDVNVMLKVHEDEEFPEDTIRGVQEDNRLLPFVNEHSKTLLCVHFFVSYNPDHKAAGTLKRKLSNMQLHMYFEDTKPNADYTVEPIKQLDLKVQTALLKDPSKNLVTSLALQRFFDKKRSLFRNFEDFAAFAMGSFHEMHTLTNIVRPVAPNTLQVAFPARGSNNDKIVVFANFMFGKSPVVMSAIESLRLLYEDTVRRKTADMASIVTLAMVENPEINAMETQVFTQEHLSMLGACKRSVRPKRSGCEDEKLKKLIEDSTKERSVTEVAFDKVEFFAKLGRISSGVMTGLMAKSLLVDIIQGNMAGVAVNTGFIVSSVLAQAGSAKLLTQGGKLTNEGRLLLGSTLKASASFLARSPSFLFVGYDLYANLHTNDTSIENKVAVGTDAAYLALDLAESAVELAEVAGLWGGVSAFTGPIGLTIGAGLLIGSDVYRAVKQVEKINTMIPLTGVERFLEGFRGFIGLKPSQKVMRMIENEQVNSKILELVVESMSKNQTIRNFITSIKTRYSCPSVDNYMNFSDTRTAPPLRSIPKLPNGYSYFCATPDFNYCKGPTFWEYIGLPKNKKNYLPVCTSAVGVRSSTASGSGHTYFQLDDGHDEVQGFNDSPNVFEIGNDKKFIIGGNEDDIFLLNGNKTTGLLDGRSGHNFLSLSHIETNASLFVTNYSVSNQDEKILILLKNIHQVYGRAHFREMIKTWCSLNSLNTFGGSEVFGSDKIFVPYSDCEYNLTTIIHGNTAVLNKATRGHFRYHIMDFGKGYSSVRIESTAKHTFTFEKNFYELLSIKAREYGDSFSISVRFSDESSFYIKILSLHNVSIAFNDGVHVHRHGKNLIASLRTDEDLTTIENVYVSIISASTISMIISNVKTNETVTLTRGKHHNNQQLINVLHSNPDHKSRLRGSSHENVYTVMPYYSQEFDVSCVKFHEVSIATANNSKNLVDLMKVRNVVLSQGSDINLDASEEINESIAINVFYSDRSSLQNCGLHIGTIRIKKPVASDSMVIMGKGPLNLKFKNGEPYLEPPPLYFNQSHNIIILSDHDIEAFTTIFINKTMGQNYKFYAYGKTVLITNVNAGQTDQVPCNILNSASTNSIAIFMTDFFESKALRSLLFKFRDMELNIYEQLMNKVNVHEIEDFVLDLELTDCVKNITMDVAFSNVDEFSLF